MDDPASPSPSPSPVPPTGIENRPRRIRSLPDRPPKMRPGGGIRSTPGDAAAAARLPGMDADGGDASWRRGVAVLWMLFVLIAAGEVFDLAIYLLAGGYQWPKVGDVLRLLALCGVFLALWFGWTWTRWVLAVVAFFAGARTVLVSFMVNYHGLRADSTHLPQAVGALFYLGAMMALGGLYLILAAYLVFSADVVAFARHRREKGRGWVVVPVGLLVGGYCVVMLGAEVIVRRSLEDMLPAMSRLAMDDMRALASRWDPDSIKTILDAEALNHWSDAGRAGFMDTVRPIGTYLGPGDEDAGVYFDAGRVGTDSFVRGECNETARCSEGRAAFHFTLARPLFGFWRVVSVTVGDVQLYEPAARPAPSPPAASTWFATLAATPVPSPGG